MLAPQRSLMESYIRTLIDSIGCWDKRFSFIPHASLLKMKGSLMVFSYFVTYKSYHKKGTLGFKQRIVKERSELLLLLR